MRLITLCSVGCLLHGVDGGTELKWCGANGLLGDVGDAAPGSSALPTSRWVSPSPTLRFSIYSRQADVDVYSPGKYPHDYTHLQELFVSQHADDSNNILVASPTEGTDAPYLFFQGGAPRAYLDGFLAGVERQNGVSPLLDLKNTGSPTLVGDVLVFPCTDRYAFFVVSKDSPGVWQERVFLDDVSNATGVTQRAGDGWGRGFYEASSQRMYFFPGGGVDSGGTGKRVVSFSPFDTDDAVRVLSDTSLVEYEYSGISNRNFTWASSWGQLKRVGPVVIFPPLLSSFVLLFNMQTETLVSFDVLQMAVFERYLHIRKWSAAEVVKNSIYFAPFDVDTALRCRVVTPEGRVVDDTDSTFDWGDIAAGWTLSCEASFQLPLAGFPIELFSDIDLLGGSHLVLTPYNAGALVAYELATGQLHCTELPQGLISHDVAGEGVNQHAKCSAAAPLSHADAEVSALLVAPYAAVAFGEVTLLSILPAEEDTTEHDSDGGMTIGVVVFMIFFGSISVFGVLFVHAKDRPAKDDV